MCQIERGARARAEIAGDGRVDERVDVGIADRDDAGSERVGAEACVRERAVCGDVCSAHETKAKHADAQHATTLDPTLAEAWMAMGDAYEGAGQPADRRQLLRLLQKFL